MKNLLLLLASSFGYTHMPHQKFKYVSLGNSSCSLYLPVDAEDFTYTRTGNGDAMHLGEASGANGVTYGVITISLNVPISDEAAAQQLVTAFMGSLQPSFSIAHVTGVEGGLPHPTCPSTKGATDYWQDSEGVDWKVKGWTDGRNVGVLYVRNINRAEAWSADIFLDSIQFR